jgi:hypothetical protein
MAGEGLLVEDFRYLIIFYYTMRKIKLTIVLFIELTDK